VKIRNRVKGDLKGGSNNRAGVKLLVYEKDRKGFSHKILKDAYEISGTQEPYLGVEKNELSNITTGDPETPGTQTQSNQTTRFLAANL